MRLQPCRAQTVHDHAPTAVVLPNHALHVGKVGFQPALQRLHRGILPRRRRAHDRVLMHAHHHIQNLPRRAGIAHAPARHGKRLGKAIQRDRPLPHARNRRERDVRPAGIRQLGIDFVGNHHNIRAVQRLRKRLHVLRLHHAAGGVVRIWEDDRLGSRRKLRPQHLRRQTEAILRRRLHRHAHAAGEHHAGHIGYIAGIGNQHLIARLNQRAQRKINALARADRDHNLARGIIAHAEARLILGNQARQLLKPAVRRVVRVPRAQRINRRV